MTARDTNTLHETHEASPSPPATTQEPDREQRDKAGTEESPRYPSANGSVPVSER